MNSNKTVRIGGASGFWGDSALGTEQLLHVEGIQYITYDYLAELTLAIMAGMRMKNPDHGYALDFVSLMQKALPTAKSKGIKVIANAGGLNPHGCANALKAALQDAMPDVKVAVVAGDNVTPQLTELAKSATPPTDMQSGQPMPPFLLTANAYLGAFPIAAALQAGADIVITGRVVDSAMTLGALIHEFGWTPSDLDKLAQGSLAGHIIECGAQATGGLFTDWQQVPDWANIGYPFIDVSPDGSFTVNKPQGTGGLINRAVITEQLLYEIHNPAHYVLPDVICDFSNVSIADIGPNQVLVSDATGKPAPDDYKVCATYPQGFRCIGLLSVVGFDAEAKAKRTAQAILERCENQLKKQGLAPYTRTYFEIVGSETELGPHRQVKLGHEAIVRIVVVHSDKKGASLFSRELAPAGTSYAPGTSGNFGMGRPNVSPMVKLFSCLLPKTKVTPQVTVNGEAIESQQHRHPPTEPTPSTPSETTATFTANSGNPIKFSAPAHLIGKPLITIAHGRSGDKGNISNVGLVARQDSDWPLLKALITPERVSQFLSHLGVKNVEIYPIENLRALNIVMHDALDGGGMTSMRNDPLGKGMAQVLLALTITG